jgi:membrane protein implicated in regulation of membrane protease activity
MEDPEVWRWIWLVAIGVFGLGEALIAGSFFLLPFAAGAVVATIVAFSGAGIAAQWVSFVAVSIVGSLALIPLRRRLDRVEPQNGVGARRLIGQEAVVLTDVPAGPGAVGEVRVGRETWRAESRDQLAIAMGTTVRVVEVRGTAVIVTTSP